MEQYEKRRFLDPKEVYAQLQRLHDKPSWQEELYQCGDSAYERREITLNAMACIDMLLFKQAIAQETIDSFDSHNAPELIRCKDCKHRPKEPNWKTYESGFDLEFPEGSKCPCRCNGDEWYSWYPEDDWFCADGVKKDG